MGQSVLSQQSSIASQANGIKSMSDGALPRPRTKVLNATGIKCWPESERPRERLIKNGVSSLSDAELLAILLRCGIQADALVKSSVADNALSSFKKSIRLA